MLLFIVSRVIYYFTPTDNLHNLSRFRPKRHPVRDAKSVKLYTLFKALDPETPMALAGS